MQEAFRCPPPHHGWTRHREQPHHGETTNWTQPCRDGKLPQSTTGAIPLDIGPLAWRLVHRRGERENRWRQAGYDFGMRRLAGSFDRDLPGLPRGRGRLAVDEVQDAQRDRILRAVISSTAEKGIASTTIADVVGRARVSRQAFYKQFESKEACLIAAIDAGIEVIVANITSTQSSTANLSLHEQLSAVIEKYLETCSSEPEFVRAWVVDLPVAGPAGVAKRNEYVELLADALLVGYSSKSSEAPGREVFLAAIGGCNELFYRQVVDGSNSYMNLHAPIMSFLERVLDLSSNPS